jgi:hypothetical protein
VIISSVWTWCTEHAAEIGVLGSLIAIIGLVGAVFRWGGLVLGWVRQRILEPLAEARAGVPKRTLIVQPSDRRATMWSDGRAGADSLTQIRVALHLSNISRQPVQVSAVWLYFRRSRFTREMRPGDISVRHPDETTFGRDFPVLPGHMAEAIGHWMISPAFTRDKEPIPVRIRVVDQFGNNCWTDRMMIYFVNDSRHLY